MQPPETSRAEDAPPPVARTIDPARATRRRLLLGLALAALIVGLYLNPREIRHPPGILVPEDPHQTAVDHASSWTHKDGKLTPVAHIRWRARVLGTERYWFDRSARWSPMDLALGWGSMSDQRVIDRLSFWQGRRWYHWTPKSALPLAPEEIMRHSANVHFIPSDEAIEKRLREVRPGQIVDFTGLLVVVESAGGSKWESSTRRDDTGNGSCEIVWMTDLIVR